MNLKKLFLLIYAGTPVFLRYGSIVVVFLILAFLSRQMSGKEYGEFILAFGVSSTAYFFFGLGTPDGMVRVVGEALENGDFETATGAVLKNIIFSVFFLFSLLVPQVVAVIVGVSNNVFILTLVWTGCWGFSFSMAQSLLSLRRVRLASFFFYSAGSASMLITVVPYAYLSDSPLASRAIQLASGGYLAAGSLAVLFVFASIPAKLAIKGESLLSIARCGLPFAGSRVIQTAFMWSVPWSVGVVNGVEEGGIAATILRVSAGVAAMLSAIRYSFRPRIVQLLVQRDFSGLDNAVFRISMIAILFSFTSVLLSSFWGSQFMVFAFGERFRSTGSLLTVALTAVLAEAVMGVTDEVIRVADRAGRILALQLALAGLFTCLVFISAKFSLLLALVVYSLQFCVFSISILIWYRLLSRSRSSQFLVTSLDTP